MIVILFYAFVSGIVLFEIEGRDYESTWPETIATLILALISGWIILPLQWYSDHKEILRRIENETRKH